VRGKRPLTGTPIPPQYIKYLGGPSQPAQRLNRLDSHPHRHLTNPRCAESTSQLTGLRPTRTHESRYQTNLLRDWHRRSRPCRISTPEPGRTETLASRHGSHYCHPTGQPSRDCSHAPHSCPIRRCHHQPGLASPTLVRTSRTRSLPDSETLWTHMASGPAHRKGTLHRKFDWTGRLFFFHSRPPETSLLKDTTPGSHDLDDPPAAVLRQRF
jgi:hypothetical protein